MKKVFLGLICCFILFLSACSKSSDDGETNTSATDDDGVATVDRSLNRQIIGSAANAILANDTYDRIQIQIVHAQGFKPQEASITNFTAFLRQYTFKEDIEVFYTELEPTGQEKITLQEIDAIEQEHRTAFNQGNTLAIYIYFTDAASDTDNEEENLVTLGAVYWNTSMVIYENTIRTIANRSSNSTEEIETATLNHEFGHLFGLVNLGGNVNGEQVVFTPMVNPHEDEEAPNHCNVEGCLMRAELQFNNGILGKNTTNHSGDIKVGCQISAASVLKILNAKAAQNSRVPGLDQECMLDLQNNGGR
ncbi:hypothetical protein [Croceivirga sp. JEA036]|uniref:hypothetical protein n=1 Tax=Croceivirga sp. JEA036 TaxID=2721162 RepID=UPI00143AED30|nr:hypothetical protein [Croceivirga sp. JEA036]NJB37310.1 hypothetical protein [Croceivirga sp. JEA036]